MAPAGTASASLFSAGDVLPRPGASLRALKNGISVYRTNETYRETNDVSRETNETYRETKKIYRERVYQRFDFPF